MLKLFLPPCKKTEVGFVGDAQLVLGNVHGVEAGAKELMGMVWMAFWTKKLIKLQVILIHVVKLGIEIMTT